MAVPVPKTLDRGPAFRTGEFCSPNGDCSLAFPSRGILVPDFQYLISRVYFLDRLPTRFGQDGMLFCKKEVMQTSCSVFYFPQPCKSCSSMRGHIGYDLHSIAKVIRPESISRNQIFNVLRRPIAQ